MDILFIADPLSHFKIYKDTTYAMMAEAARRGHAVHTCEPKHLAWTGGDVEANVQRFAIVGDVTDLHRDVWYAAEPAAPRTLKSFSAVLMRKDPPFDTEYIYSTYILERAEVEGCLIVNRPGGLRDMNEKVYTAWFPQCCAPTLITRDMKDMESFLAEHGKIVSVSVAVLYVLPEHGFCAEAQLLEHGDGRPLVDRHLHAQLLEPEP